MLQVTFVAGNQYTCVQLITTWASLVHFAANGTPYIFPPGQVWPVWHMSRSPFWHLAEDFSREPL